MNLHIAPDDKFLDYFIATQKVVTQSVNKYIVYSEKELIFTKSKADVEVTKLYSQEFWELVGDFNQYKNIFIHYFDNYLADFVLKTPKNITIIWCFWGADAFYLPKIDKNAYLPKTKEYIKNLFPNTFKKMKWAWKPWNLYYEYKTYKESIEYTRNHIKAMKRINYFAHYLKEDYNILKQNYPLCAKFIDFNYATIEEMVSNKDMFEGKNILLGNSANMTNNHIESIDYLKNVELDIIKVICPLSYSVKEEYVSYIKKYGQESLGGAFVPLIDFIEKTEYDILLKSCQFAIMNHIRSQAAGNIVALLYRGTTIYMHPKSTLFHFLKNNGLIVRSVQELVEKGLEAITLTEMENNRRKIQQLFGKKVVQDKYTHIFDTLEN